MKIVEKLAEIHQGDLERLLAKAIGHAADTKRLKDAATQASEQADADVQRLLRELGSKRANDGEWQATLVEAERVKIDEHKLRDVVSREVWEFVTDRKLNRSKLEEAVEKGLVPAEWVAEVATVEKNKPYVRISMYEADADAG